MSEQMCQIVEESIKLERNAAELYDYFSSIFPNDNEFWQKLSIEEHNHANLINIGRKVLLSCDEFPRELLAPAVEDLVAANNKITSVIKEVKDNPPSRESAFNIALSLEKSAGEIHYQRAMEMHPATEYIQIFQNLNYDDKDHARRIREYMNS